MASNLQLQIALNFNNPSSEEKRKPGRKYKYSYTTKLVPSGYLKSKSRQETSGLINRPHRVAEVDASRSNSADPSKAHETTETSELLRTVTERFDGETLQRRSVTPVNMISIMNKTNSSKVSINIKYVGSVTVHSQYEAKQSRFEQIDSVLRQNESKMFPRKFSIVNPCSKPQDGFLPKIKPALDLNATRIQPVVRSFVSKPSQLYERSSSLPINASHELKRVKDLNRKFNFEETQQSAVPAENSRGMKLLTKRYGFVNNLFSWEF